MQPIYPAIATCLALAFYLIVTMLVGRQRARHSIPAPTTSGPADFERAFRVQQNTVEQLVIFLPVLWLYAFYVSSLWAGIAGLVWVIGRIVFAVCYIREPSSRGPGMSVTFGATLWLLLGAIWGIAHSAF